MRQLHRLEYESGKKYMRFYSIITLISLTFTVALYSLKSDSLSNMDYKESFSTSDLILIKNVYDCKRRIESPETS